MNDQSINIEHRIGQYVQLRDKIKALDDAHKEAMAPYRDALEQLNGVLLGYLNTIGADNAKTAMGTVYKTEKKSATLADKEAFWNYVVANEQWDLLDYKANATAVGQFIDDNQSLPPGVNWTTTNVVGVRRG